MTEELPQTQGASPQRQRDSALQAARVAYREAHGRWPSRSWNLMATPTPAAPFKSPEREAWDRAYGDRPITPEAAVWDDRGYCRWLPETNKMGSRLSHSRNFPNPNN
jgi:hypothetical protein